MQKQQLEQHLANNAAAHDQEVEHLRGGIAEATAANASSLAQLRNTKQEAVAAEESARGVQQQLVTSQAQLKQAKTDLHLAITAKADLSTQHLKEVQGLQQQLANANVAKVQVTAALQEAQLCCEHERSQLRQLQTDTARLRQEHAADEQQVKGKLEEAETCKAHLAAQLLQEEGCRQRADLQVELLEAEQSSLTATIDQLQQQMHVIETAQVQEEQRLAERPSQADLDSAIAERGSLSEQLQELQRQIHYDNDIASQLQQARTDLLEQREHAEQMQNEHDQLLVLLSERTSELNTLQEQHEKNQDAFRAAGEYLAEVEADYKQQLEGRHTHIKALQAELADAHEGLSAVTAHRYQCACDPHTRISILPDEGCSLSSCSTACCYATYYLYATRQRVDPTCYSLCPPSSSMLYPRPTSFVTGAAQFPGMTTPALIAGLTLRLRVMGTDQTTQMMLPVRQSGRFLWS